MKVAVVAGVNKNLVKRNVKPVLLSPNTSIGRDAEVNLKMLGYDVEYRSPNDFANFMWGLEKDFDKLDILINTADMVSHQDSKEACRMVITNNFYDNLHLTRSLLPLIKKSPTPRIVNVLGTINPLYCSANTPSHSSPTIMEAFLSEAKTVPQLDFLVKDYLNDVDLGDHQAKGWPSSSYAMSRLALISLTKILAREERPVLVNACNSDYLLDEELSERGNMSVVESAVNPVILATELPNDGPTGRLFSDDLPITW